MGCTKQMLFRECVVINGEHDFPEFENLKQRTIEAVKEGSPTPKTALHILEQDSPLARKKDTMGHSVTSSNGLLTRDPRLGKDWGSYPQKRNHPDADTICHGKHASDAVFVMQKMDAGNDFFFWG